MRKLFILMIAVTFVLGFSASAMAQQKLFYTEKERLDVEPTKELEIYGSVRVMTYITDKDPATGFDDSDLAWALDDGSSRLGVRFKSGKIGANAEFRPRDRQSARTRTMSIQGTSDLLRHWYGTYDLGWGTFLIGQTWTPSFNPICNECLVGGGGILDAYGDMGGTARAAGMQLWVPMAAVNGLLKVALLTPWVDNSTGPPGPVAIVPGYDSTDTTLPKIEASLSGAFGPLGWNIRGGYNTYDVKHSGTDATESVDSYLLAFSPTYAMGPLYFKGNIYIGQNHTVYGMGGPEVTFGLWPEAFTGTNIQDVDNFGWFAVVGFKINDMISIEGGYGERESEQDTPAGTVEEDASAFVVFFPITVAPGFVITPEVLFADEGAITGPSGASSYVSLNPDRGDTTYYGIYWRIDF